uniref:Protease inhibitor nigrescinin-4 n=1 Tax=Ceratitis capitata TaxID=7213 RepID=W8CC99_CERCA
MKFLLTLCFAACFIATLQAAAVDSTTAQPKAAEAADASTTVAPTEASDVVEECHQPKETGRCFGLFYRYAYNVENRQCEEFVYGGCNGNKNNFESKEDCEAKCLAAKKDEAPKEAEEGEESSTLAKEGDEDAPVVPVVEAKPVAED